MAELERIVTSHVKFSDLQVISVGNAGDDCFSLFAGETGVGEGDFLQSEDDLSNVLR